MAEVGEVARRYQIFTVFLILFGADAGLYTLGLLIETMFEGRLDGQFRRRRMQRRIDRMSGHVAPCGYGQVAALVSHPEVAEFLDVVMHDGDFEVRLAERRITAGSVFADRTLADCAIRSATGASVLAVRRGGSFVTNPSPHLVFVPDALLICFGTDGQLEASRMRSQEV